MRSRGSLHNVDVVGASWVAYVALTGQSPCRGRKGLESILARLQAEEIPRPSEPCPGIHVAVDAWFLRAFSRDLQGRFQTATEMAQAFSKALRGVFKAEATTSTSDSPPPPRVTPATPRRGRAERDRAKRRRSAHERWVITALADAVVLAVAAYLGSR